jgi:SNF2 family DNA or RNA helicase
MEISEFQHTRVYPTFKKICDFGKMEIKIHQVQALMWMLQRENSPNDKTFGLRGGIIADEMGLGKTFQMISLITCNFKLRTLIVLPPILIQQWIDAFKSITGHKPFVYHNKYTKKIDIDQLQNSPVVITSYAMIGSSEKKVPNILHQIKWSRIIFDEAHHLRNRKTSNFMGASTLKSNIKWFVTGTPIQNKINDLYALCDILGMPRKIYRNKDNYPLIKGELVLRRTKADIQIQLPPIQMNHVIIPLNDCENPIFDELHSILSLNFEKNTDTEDEDETSSEEFDDNVNEIVIKPKKIREDPFVPESKLFTRLYDDNTVLPAFMKARQLCIYPAMLQKTIYDNKRMIVNSHDLSSYYNCSADTKKLDTLMSFLRRRRENKKIVFCYFKREIDYISDMLKLMNIPNKKIDGRTSADRKTSILKKSPEVLILQIQTSCEGLNLQQYSEVYFTSPHWNPAIESQAIARCHRTGQTKDVHVFKFIFTSTNIRSIEEYILHIQKYKTGIANKIL